MEINKKEVKANAGVGVGIKNVPINIKITEHHKKWIDDGKYSPTRIFGAGCKALGYDPK